MDVRHQPGSGDQVFASDQAPPYPRSDRDRNQRCPGGDGDAKKTPRVECPRCSDTIAFGSVDHLPEAYGDDKA
jgi:hypothetical protein